MTCLEPGTKVSRVGVGPRRVPRSRGPEFRAGTGNRRVSILSVGVSSFPEWGVGPDNPEE